MATKTATTTRTSTATAANAKPADVLTAFDGFIARCNEHTGPAPSAALLKKAVALGLKPGTKKAFAAAMYMRTKGATQSQVSVALNGPQLNVMREAVARGIAIRVDLPKVDGHVVYKMALPEAKPVKAKRKPRAAKAKPEAATPTTE